MVTRIVIVGGGPAGYEAALVASQLGAEVTLVEPDGLQDVGHADPPVIPALPVLLAPAELARRARSVPEGRGA